MNKPVSRDLSRRGGFVRAIILCLGCAGASGVFAALMAGRADAQPPPAVQGSSFMETPKPVSRPAATPAPGDAAAGEVLLKPSGAAPAAGAVGTAPGGSAAAVAAAIAAAKAKNGGAAVTPTPPPAGATPPPPPAVQAGGYETVGFGTLAGYRYRDQGNRAGGGTGAAASAPKKDQIPPEIHALKGRKVAVEGYMVPMEVDDNGAVKSFVLVKTQPQCCFGDTQAMNEWIDVKMKGGARAEFSVDRPMTAFGVLDVGEQTEDGFVLSIYRMTADKTNL